MAKCEAGRGWAGGEPGGAGVAAMSAMSWWGMLWRYEWPWGNLWLMGVAVLWQAVAVD